MKIRKILISLFFMPLITMAQDSDCAQRVRKKMSGQPKLEVLKAIHEKCRDKNQNTPYYQCRRFHLETLNKADGNHVRKVNAQCKEFSKELSLLKSLKFDKPAKCFVRNCLSNTRCAPTFRQIQLAPQNRCKELLAARECMQLNIDGKYPSLLQWQTIELTGQKTQGFLTCADLR